MRREEKKLFKERKNVDRIIKLRYIRNGGKCDRILHRKKRTFAKNFGIIQTITPRRRSHKYK
jgi:hypothetical protein